MQEKMETSEEIQPNEKWVLLDLSKLPHLLEIGWHAFKLCPITSDKDDRKRLTLKSFDDCLQEKTMVELCQPFAELSLKD